MNTVIKAFLFVMMVYPTVGSAQTNSCDAKRSSIEKEIAYAQAHDNIKRVEGLKTALAQMNKNCTDAGLRSDAQREVVEAQEKLAEREHDLLEAKADGKSAETISNRQRKVDEAQAELEKKKMEASS